MNFLVSSIRRTADIAGGFIVGQLVIDPTGVFIQKGTGELIPAIGSVEVLNGDRWQTLTAADFNEETVYGNPLYAGAEARALN